MSTLSNTETTTQAKLSLGPYPSKLGREELIELIDLWELSADTRGRIEQLLQEDSQLRGPHLFRYYNPRPSKVEAAEGALARLVGVEHCLAVNSCTSALVCAYRALGIGAGDEVIVPGYTFFATAATVVACNAIPFIVDVDDTLCLSPEAVERAITKRTKAIVAVHMRGAPAQMDALLDVADRNGLPLIEDVAQAGGGSFHGRRLGSLGDMGCFSFDYYKVHASGEGGFVTTDDAWLYTRAQSWHDAAACWRPNRYAAERKSGELFCGENYRMSELQGAVALAQIRKTETMLEGYRNAFRQVKEQIEPVPGMMFRRVPDESGDTCIALIFFLKDADTTRRALAAMQEHGVPAGGIYDQKVRDWHIYTYWQHIMERKHVAPDGLPWSAVPAGELPRYDKDMCPRALDLLSRAVMIDIDWHYSEEDCRQIADAVNRSLRSL